MKAVYWSIVSFGLLPVLGSAQADWRESQPYYLYDTYGYGEFDREIPIDYQTHPSYSQSQLRNNDPYYESSYFGRNYDNSYNFTSGISSYQGTSTGPGLNGGYAGTPRGVYQTNYVDRSIYPNTYMKVYSR